MNEIWFEIDLRSRKTGNTVETICSTMDHDEACRALDEWYWDNGIEFPDDVEQFVDGSDGVFADIYITKKPHGVGKWG